MHYVKMYIKQIWREIQPRTFISKWAQSSPIARRIHSLLWPCVLTPTYIANHILVGSSVCVKCKQVVSINTTIF
jgi:hypothetical protein